MNSPDYEVEYKEELYDFSTALDALKKWDRITRQWWNGKWLYITLQNPDSNSKMTLQYIYMGIKKCNCYWTEKACNNCWKYNRIPWIASQSDLLSEDWIIL